MFRMHSGTTEEQDFQKFKKKMEEKVQQMTQQGFKELCEHFKEFCVEQSPIPRSECFETFVFSQLSALFANVQVMADEEKISSEIIEEILAEEK